MLLVSPFQGLMKERPKMIFLGLHRWEVRDRMQLAVFRIQRAVALGRGTKRGGGMLSGG